MTVGFDPQRTCDYQPFLIHVHSLHCGSTCWSQALNPPRVIYPHEMILPVLPSRIKQRNRRARCSIQGGGGRGFTQVAARASKAQVLRNVATVGINVLDVHRLANRVLTRLTVFTAIPRAFVRPGAQWRPMVIHSSAEDKVSTVTRHPRSVSRAAAWAFRKLSR